MEHSSLKTQLSTTSDHTLESGIERRTLPSIASSFLAKIEAIKLSRGLEGLAMTPLETLDSCGQDLVLTYLDKPELIKQAATILKEDPRKVTIHIALCNGFFFMGVFVGVHLRRGRAANEVLKLLSWPEFVQVITEGQEPLSLNLEEL